MRRKRTDMSVTLHAIVMEGRRESSIEFVLLILQAFLR